MSTDQQNLIDAVLSLPPEGQRQVAALVAQLARQHPAPTQEPDLAKSAFVGMWKDRADLADSTAWVRGVRKSEW